MTPLPTTRGPLHYQRHFLGVDDDLSLRPARHETLVILHCCSHTSKQSPHDDGLAGNVSAAHRMCTTLSFCDMECSELHQSNMQHARFNVCQRLRWLFALPVHGQRNVPPLRKSFPSGNSEAFQHPRPFTARRGPVLRVADLSKPSRESHHTSSSWACRAGHAPNQSCYHMLAEGSAGLYLSLGIVKGTTFSVIVLSQAFRKS